MGRQTIRSAGASAARLGLARLAQPGPVVHRTSLTQHQAPRSLRANLDIMLLHHHPSHRVVRPAERPQGK